MPKFAPPVAHHSLRDADVVHSPWFALPKDLLKRRRLKPFTSEACADATVSAYLATIDWQPRFPT